MVLQLVDKFQFQIAVIQLKSSFEKINQKPSPVSFWNQIHNLLWSERNKKESCMVDVFLKLHSSVQVKFIAEIILEVNIFYYNT